MGKAAKPVQQPIYFHHCPAAQPLLLLLRPPVNPSQICCILHLGRFGPAGNFQQQEVERVALSELSLPTGLHFCELFYPLTPNDPPNYTGEKEQ